MRWTAMRGQCMELRRSPRRQRLPDCGLFVAGKEPHTEPRAICHTAWEATW
eukprot:CAMPEP_0204561144 /NCGR_PEP_ID=MMETSP0661-20131031/33022_1 /ASSEMBLY_ACC=CAM_ASM_000606 /TAXON_ID=109239 /ORGANISM="Alexandrium margalefi, Strain AMGDE01CS-322" /LENGTH=50 /DNA_ID=CAMNT_0051568539 /DNA_START=86 /DNA_END=235 /DNA_ORIENTATION=+